MAVLNAMTGTIAFFGRLFESCRSLAQRYATTGVEDLLQDRLFRGAGLADSSGQPATAVHRRLADRQDHIQMWLQTQRSDGPTLSRPMSKPTTTRASASRPLAAAKRELDLACQSYRTGLLEEDDVRDDVVRPRTERKQLEANLAGAEQPPETVARNDRHCPLQRPS